MVFYQEYNSYYGGASAIASYDFSSLFYVTGYFLVGAGSYSSIIAYSLDGTLSQVAASYSAASYPNNVYYPNKIYHDGTNIYFCTEYYGSSLAS